MSTQASRRSFLAALGAVPAAALQQTSSTNFWTKEYFVQKGAVRLYLFRKRRAAPRAGETALPVLFLVHGSSLSSRSTFDLHSGGKLGDYPVVEPTQVQAPVLLVRGEYDGIATEEDLISFFTKLPNGDRQLTVLGGMAHSVVLGYNREALWQVTRSFLERPLRHDQIKS